MLIRRRPGHTYSIGYILRQLKCNSKELALAVKLLRETGYKISHRKKGTVALSSTPDLLLSAEIAGGLSTRILGRHIHAYKTVQSTNIIAGQLAGAETPEGTIVVAEAQTKGRGRLGRTWFSREERGIYLSMVVYPKIEPMHAPGLSLLTAISLAETIASLDDLTVKIKWPNDCLVNGKKVAGILTEVASDIDHIHHAVIGVGINVNHQRKDFPEDIRKTATSLRIETKEIIHRVKFLQLFLKNFERDYLKFRRQGLKSIKKRIMIYSHIIGKEISLDRKGQIFTGIAVDIDDSGGLVVDTGVGKQIFNAGEVTVVKKRK